MRQAVGIADDDDPDVATKKIAAALASAESGALAAERVAELIGFVEAGAAAEEGFWGVRMLFETLAGTRPLVVVLDDLHWAEPTLLDLVEYVADRSHRTPLVLLAMARHELLELRPGWTARNGNSVTLTLEPLSPGQSERLIENLLGEATLDPTVASRIQEAAEGNPLFVEETLSMLMDDGLLRRDDGRWVAAAICPACGWRRPSRLSSPPASTGSRATSDTSSSVLRWRARSSTRAPSGRSRRVRRASGWGHVCTRSFGRSSSVPTRRPSRQRTAFASGTL